MAEQRPSGGGETRDEPGSKPAQVRGCVVTARLAYIANRWTNDHKNLILGRFGANERRRLESVAADGDWFDYQIVETIDTFILRELARGDRSVLRDLGRACADHNLKRILAIRTGGLGPELVLQRLCRMPLLDNFGEGEFATLEIPGKLGVALTFTYPPAVTELYVEGAVGFYERLLERLGGSNVVVSVQPVPSRGANTRRFDLQWEIGGGEEETEESSRALTDSEVSGESLDEANREPSEPASGERRSPRPQTTSTPAAPPATAQVAKPATSPRSLGGVDARTKVVAAVLAVAAIVIVGEWLWFSGAFEPTFRADLAGHKFSRSGDLEVVVTFDDQFVMVEAGTTLREVKVKMTQGSKLFTATYPTLPRSALWQIDTSQFRSPDGSRPTVGEMPSKVVVEAAVDGTTKVAEFKP